MDKNESCWREKRGETAESFLRCVVGSDRAFILAAVRRYLRGERFLSLSLSWTQHTLPQNFLSPSHPLHPICPCQGFFFVVGGHVSISTCARPVLLVWLVTLTRHKAPTEADGRPGMRPSSPGALKPHEKR